MIGMDTAKEKRAIQYLKAFEPQTEPYYLCYSGGKDSDVIRILASLAGVKHDIVNNHTTVDAPETVRYIRSIPNVIIERPERTMWQLIEQKRMPPTRVVRYCCAELKEHGGKGRVKITGVRKVEQCYRTTSTMINPIVDWENQDVWEFLNYYGCESNPLYREGFCRIGCIGCPLSGHKTMKNHFARYPKYKEMYIHAFDRMITKRKEDGLPTVWQDGEECFTWWVGDDPNQISFDDYDEDWYLH